MTRIIPALAICLLPALAFGQGKQKRPAPAVNQAVNQQALSILKQAAILVAQGPAPEKETDDSRVRLLTDLGELQWRSGDRVSARRAFEEALIQAKQVKLSPDDLKGGSAAVQTVATGRARARDVGGLQPLLSLLTDFKDPEGYGGKPRRSEVLKELATAQAEAGDLKAALATLTKVEDEWTRRFASTDLIRVLVRRGDIPSAQALLEKVDAGHRDYATQVMVSALADAGKLPEAIAMVSTLEAPAEESGSSLFAPINHKAGAQGHIARAQAKAGDIAGALRTVTMMPDREDKADALSAIVFAQRKAGDPAGAERSYEQCRSIRADVEKNHFDLSNVATNGMNAAQLAGRAGKWAEARKIAEGGFNDGSLFGRFALNGLVYAYEEAGDYAGALEAVKLAKDPGTFFYGIGRAQATDGDLVGALTWASAEASPKWKAAALIGIARGVLDRAGKATSAH